jgi:DNA polymerase-3 subunit epsilon
MSNIYEKDAIGKKSFRNRPLAIVDIETTGLDSEKHEIIEIAVLVVDLETLEITGKYHAKVWPKHLETADPRALEMNGYTKEAWRDAKPLKTVLDELNQLAPGAMFAGWNVSFDRPFIEKAARDEDTPLHFDYHWIDIMTIAYWELFSDERIERLSLTYVCEKLDIPFKKAHTAMGDITATLEVYRFLKRKAK